MQYGEERGMKPKTIKVNLKYTFTPEEKQEIATTLARANQRKVELEEQKKQVDADLKAQITETESAIAREARRYTTGYEYRDIDCSVVYHSPRQGFKTIYRIDTGEWVREMEMNSTELQENLFEQEQVEA
jgi:hypothetical protein